MNALASWSGGKDSCLACYKAMRQGYDIKYLVNFISREFKRCCFHGVEAGLIKMQAQSMGIPLIQKEVSADMKEYENDFKTAISGVADCNAVVFGDIYLDEHKDWVERVCKDAGKKAVEPLWNSSTTALLHEFLDAGFKTVVVSCQADKFDRDFVGRYVDKKMIADLTSKGICPCGENGEFHTLVVDGPLFKKPINIIKSEPVLKESFWKYWFLDIKEYN